MSEIAESLKDSGPITVGLDLDSTTFYSWFAFYYGMTNIDGPNSTNVYGDDPLNNPVFFHAVNNEFAGYYIPKKAAIDIVGMHQKRGDTVIFITKRYQTPDERTSDYISTLFGIKDPIVIFTNVTTKTPAINAENVSVYYVDSDGDITESQAARNCTSYRFL